jgi:hypothetical protein
MERRHILRVEVEPVLFRDRREIGRGGWSDGHGYISLPSPPCDNFSAATSVAATPGRNLVGQTPCDNLSDTLLACDGGFIFG